MPLIYPNENNNNVETTTETNKITLDQIIAYINLGIAELKHFIELTTGMELPEEDLLETQVEINLLTAAKAELEKARDNKFTEAEFNWLKNHLEVTKFAIDDVLQRSVLNPNALAPDVIETLTDQAANMKSILKKMEVSHGY